MARLTLTAPPRGTHRRTSEAWQALTEDLDAADQRIRELEAELGQVRAVLADERRVRGHCDALIGQTVTQRDNAAGHAQHAYELVRDRDRQLQRAQAVIEDLRQRASGQKH